MAMTYLQRVCEYFPKQGVMWSTVSLQGLYQQWHLLESLIYSVGILYKENKQYETRQHAKE